VTAVLGGAVAAAGGWPQPGWKPWVAVLAALLLTGASNVLNQIADLETDRINRPRRPLPAGDATPRQAWVLFWATALASLGLSALVNVFYWACCAITLPLTAAYSLPPMRTKRVPFLANATIATPRGLLMVVAGWAAGGGFARSEAWILGVLAWC
jgi:4-hydroxybenzoate polyprenyltransferase